MHAAGATSRGRSSPIASTLGDRSRPGSAARRRRPGTASTASARPLEGESDLLGLEGLPLDAAVVLEHGEHRVPVGQGAARRRRCASNTAQRGRRLAQRAAARRCGRSQRRSGGSPAIGGARTPCRRVGCAAPSSCWRSVRRGVDDVTRARRHQRIASDDCVRGRARTARPRRLARARSGSSTEGTLPPAAEPRTRERARGGRIRTQPQAGA